MVLWSTAVDRRRPNQSVMGWNYRRGVPISRVRLSSVASDSLQGDLVAQMKSQFNAEVAAAKVSSSAAGVTCGYDDPSSLGIDRWLGMVASYSRYQASVLVVDAGSAMTLDW